MRRNVLPDQSLRMGGPSEGRALGPVAWSWVGCNVRGLGLEGPRQSLAWVGPGTQE